MTIHFSRSISTSQIHVRNEKNGSEIVLKRRKTIAVQCVTWSLETRH